MIDPTIEELLTQTEATKLPELRRNGRPVHISTLSRWLSAGILESITIGGLRMTSAEAVRRMIARQNPTIPTISPAQRQREIDATEDRLAAVGV